MNQPRAGSDAVAVVAEPEPAMDDAEFMDALEHGPPAPLSLYRHAYAAAGVPWPGDDEVRRRHPVTEADNGADIPTSVRVLSWPDSE
ncbi:MAG: hypothetical protein GEV12_09360 [Micromonosporaceae bacterium]|nr:hypothetical protein [Micromonosporaceae bacterium]